MHIVLADEGSFRRERQPPSASVVIRTDGGDDRATGAGDPPSRRRGRSRHEDRRRHRAQRRRPAARLGHRTSIEKSPDNLLALEKEVSQEIREGVTRTLTPYLSPRNFQISRRRAAQRRQDADERDDLQPRPARRAVGAR